MDGIKFSYLGVIIFVIILTLCLGVAVRAVSRSRVKDEEVRKLNRKQLIFSLLVTSILIFATSSYMLIYEMAEYKKSAAVYEEAATYVSMPSANGNMQNQEAYKSTGEENQEETSVSEELNIEEVNTMEETVDDREEKIELPQVDFTSLRKKAPEVVAWIIAPDTVINYPVTQGKDNEFYLEHLYDGRANKVGSIFLDYRNRKTLTNRNTIIYGHNMRDGSMFAGIKEYTKSDYFKAHPILYLMTPKRSFMIEVFSAFVANPKEVEVGISPWTISFADNFAFETWLSSMQERSAVKSDMELSHSDKVVTLSTCTNNGEERFIVMGKLKIVE